MKGGVAVKNDISRSEAFRIFMMNSKLELKVLTNDSISCITIVATIPIKDSPYVSMQPNNFATDIDTILIKLMPYHKKVKSGA